MVRCVMPSFVLVDALIVVVKNGPVDLLASIYENYCNQMLLAKLNEIVSTVDISTFM